MSGITPILDTLLHQVLGRRDAPVDRPLPDQLIAPPRAGLPPQAAHSDSRLDPRPLPTTRTAIGAGDKVGRRAVASRDEMPADSAQGQAVTTRFSTAARIIAGVLTRFPASPPGIRAQAPLVAAGERTHVAKLAAQLRDSIESSGLFYEAHLLRWRGGTFPLAQLLREPQMLWSGRAVATPQPQPPLPQGQAAAAAPSNAGTAAPVPTSVGDPAPPPNAPAAASQGYGADGKPVERLPATAAGSGSQPAQPSGLALAFTGDDRIVHSALEGVLRHQLEMLAAPVLRWEGAPWAGAAMVLTLQPPPYQREQQRSSEEGRSRQDADAPWQTHLTLRLARLGEVKVNLQLGAQRIALDLEAEAEAAGRMDADSGTLRARLGALGFQQIALRIHASDPLDGGHD